MTPRLPDPLPPPEPVRVTMADVKGGVMESWAVIVGAWVVTLVGLAVVNTWMGNW